MDERLRETLSAMMDDEADELSVRRLLSHDDQNEVREQWQRWQQVRDLMHEAPSASYSVDVAGAVRAAIDDQDIPIADKAEPVPRAGGYWHWPVAAMVTLALLVGFGAGAGWGTAPGDPNNALAFTGVDQRASQLALSKEEIALQRLDEQQLRQVRQYLLEHAQHNSVGAGRGSMGYARMVSANGGY